MNFWRLLVVLLTGVSLILSAPGATAQGCDDVSIQYTEPDCYKPRPGSAPGGGAGNGKSCPGASACEDERYTYTAAGGPWASYSWTVASGPASPVITPSVSAPSIDVVWAVPGTYVLTLTVTDGSGNVYTKCLEVSVKERPVANFSFSPNGACAGSVVSFSNSTTFGGTAMYAWSFGDPASGAANTSSAANPTHVFSSPGVYNVTLVAYSSITTYVVAPGHGDMPSTLTCCADTVRMQVTVVSGNVKIECISTVCPGKKATYTAAGCASPVWGTPVGGTTLSTSGNTITVQWGSGNPQGQLSVACGGCTSYATVPIVPAVPVITGPLSPCQSGSAQYTAPWLPGTDYQWTLTNTTTSTVENHLLSTYPEQNSAWIDWGSSTPGSSYQLSLTLQNKHICCGGTASISITPRPQFRINNPPSVCAGSSAGFFPTVPGTYSWAVTPASGVTPTGGTGGSFNSVFSTPGTYTVTATNTGTNTCNLSASATVAVVATPAPGSISGPLSVCANNPYSYAMTTPAPAGYYYEWTISSGTFQPLGGTTVQGNSAIAQFSSLPGTIIVRLKQGLSPFCDVPADTITVNGATVGAITGPASVCVDATASYTLGGSLPAGTSVTWTVSPASLGTITAGQGSTTVTVLWHGTGGSGPWGPAAVSATTGCGAATPQGGIMINPKFVVNITPGGTDICQPGGMSLTANGAPAGASFIWSPAGSTQTITGITAAGSYSVTAAAGGCSASDNIVLEDPFQIRAIACGVPICTSTGIAEVLGVEVLKPGSGTFTYEWRTGTCLSPGAIIQSSTGAFTTNQFTATAPGTYCVIVKYGNCQKCVSFVVKNICCPDVNQPVFTIDTQLSCNTYQFAATTSNPTGAALSWDFGDGTTATAVSGVPVTHTYSLAGVYCVTFCVGPPTPNTAGCTGNCAATTAVVPIQPQFTWTLGCNGCLSVTNTSLVFGNSAFVSYSWDWGDMTTPGSGQSPAPHCYAAGGTYTVTLTMTYNDGTVSCSKTFQQSVTHTPLAISNTAPVCAGVPASFSSLPGGFVSYNWSFGDGFNGFSSPIQHAYAASGTYYVTLSVLDALGNTCTKTDTLSVMPGFGGCSLAPGYICPGSSAVLTAPAGATTYQWEVETAPGSFSAAPGPNTAATYATSTPGYYRVIVTNSNGCSCTTARAPVTLVPKPKASFTVDASKKLCNPGGLVLLTAASIPNHTYSWFMNGSFGTPLSTGPVTMQYVGTTTSFTLVVANQYGCTDTCTQTITVDTLPPKPTISTTSICAGTPVSLSVTNYTTNLSWSTGDTTQSIVVFAAGTYIATYTDPATGCSNSAGFTLRKRPPAGLFPHSCDSISCSCTRPFTIYAPKPLQGQNVSGFAVQWFDALSNAPLATGTSYNNGGLGVQTGSYYVVLTDSVTGCKDTSKVYSVVVPPCDTCDCKGSSWGKLTLASGSGASPTGAAAPIGLSCGKRVSIACNQAYTLSAAYNCKDTACNGKVTYLLQPPSGSPVSGSGPLTFTTSVSGVYTVKVYGWCGNKPCDSCVMYFVVSCPCDCKGSSWGAVTLSTKSGNGTPAGSATTTTLSCKKNYALECNKAYTMAAAYNCADSACNGKVTYKIQGPSGAPLTGTMPFTATPVVSGTYTVTLYGWCGQTICDSCVMTFTVSCPCSCKESYWGKITMTPGDDDSLHLDKIGDPKPVATTLSCKKSYNLDCKSPYTFNAAYFCKDSSCPRKVTYSLQPPSGPAVSGTMPFNLTPALTGTYTLTVYAWCGDAICDSCVIRLNVNCDCCKGSKWRTKTIADGTTTKNLICGSYNWPCNQAFSINAVYDCATAACGGTASYQLVPPSGAGPVVTGAFPGPLSYTPTVSGTYTVTLYGYCGGQRCDSCVISFKVDCPKDTACCKYDIAVKPGPQTYSQSSGVPATVLSQGFGVAGLTGVPLSEVRAEVLSFDITANYDDCLPCKSQPFILASVRAAAAISGVPGLVTLYAGATTSIFSPTGAAVYQNPREVVWNNGSNFMITGPLQIDFFLPPMPKPDCCKLRGRICVKFSFRGVDCTECEAITCFDVAIP